MIAIIPARGGSKELPGKNIKLLSGRPLIAYSIMAALNAEKIDRVIVSTDSNKIADVALEFGAESLAGLSTAGCRGDRRTRQGLRR